MRIDPSLNRAIEYAIAEKLISAHVRSETCVLQLEPGGLALASQIIADTDCMVEEQAFAEALRGQRVTNDRVEQLLNWEATL
ncbi:hypothetical protein BGE01nite_43980 [Brevifollis gellanilyticus]|uniref:Uncharacterized protein n=1 Tax=Brevifollis gellanilyticus TaxID=748831 RepID=A0A512MEE8_9BACT|nr:hypothetical protein BGE01nite_43980 [Brevifollis gellanilyticus]